MVQRILRTFLVIINVLLAASVTAERPVAVTPPNRLPMLPDENDETLTAQLVGRADTAIAQERWSDAAVLLSDALRSADNDAARVMVLSNLGMTYAGMRQDTLALKMIDSALTIAPNMVAVIKNRAMLNLNAGRDGEAYDDFERIILIDTLNLEGHYYHGLMALYAGMPEVAKRDFDVLQRLAPTGHGTNLAWANYYALTRRDLEAIPYYRKVLERDKAPEYFAALAGCYLATDNLTEASATIAEGLKMAPDDPELYYYRAWLNRDRLLLDDAHADARRAIALGADPGHVNALFE